MMVIQGSGMMLKCSKPFVQSKMLFRCPACNIFLRKKIQADIGISETSEYSSLFRCPNKDENIKGWHKGLFGRQVQNSALGTLKRCVRAVESSMRASRFLTGYSHAGADTVKTVMSKLQRHCFLQVSINEPASVRNTRILRRSGCQTSIPRMRY